jgi:hypothetical protein
MVFAALVAGGIGLISWGWQHRGNKQTNGTGQRGPTHAAATNALPPAADPSAPPGSGTSPSASNPPASITDRPGAARYSWFQRRPLAVASESETYQWTSADGKDLNVIQQLAHNDLEFERMVSENDRIIRRQLVYHKETTEVLVQRARLSGEPLRRLTLPGLDGQEVQFEITATDLSASGQQGAFAGYVTGRPDSTVTLAFKGGREAFTIISPSDVLYLQGDPREPGEIIVKSINPETYVQGTCGVP